MKKTTRIEQNTPISAIYHSQATRNLPRPFQQLRFRIPLFFPLSSVLLLFMKSPFLFPRYLTKALCTLFVAFAFHSICIQAQQPTTLQVGATTLQVSNVITGLDVPWEILWGPDDHIWLTERDGLISRLNPETGIKTVLLDIAAVYQEQESGLLGLALHPDFTNNPYIYTVYTYLQGGSIFERMVRYTYDPSNNTLSAPFVFIEGITGNTTHDGARLLISGDYLFMSTGDAQDQPSAQNINDTNGKILRFKLDGSIPDDNPIPGNPVWSWGHRNAQGMVMAPNGILYSSEHGPTTDDEFNIIEPGRNYGWPTVAGYCNSPTETTFCTNNNVKEPLMAWTPTIAPGGIDYYNHPAIPEWQHSILMCVLKNKRLSQLTLSADGLQVTEEIIWLQNAIGRIRDICIAPNGDVYLASSNRDGYGTPISGDDRIIRLHNADYVPPVYTQALFSEQDSCLSVRFNNLSSNADSYLWIFGDGAGSTLTNPIYTYAEAGTYTVQLIAQNEFGTDTMTMNVTVDTCLSIGTQSITKPNIRIYPNPVATGGILQISYPNAWAGANLQISDSKGAIWHRQILTPNSSQTSITLRQMPVGSYQISIKGQERAFTTKIVVQE